MSSHQLDSRAFPAAPPNIAVRVALRLHQVLRHLADRCVPADVATFFHVVGVAETAMIGVAVRCGFADFLDDAKAPMTAAQLALAAGTDADATHRMLRALAYSGVFTLHRDGRFSNNRLSNSLRRADTSRMRALCEYISSRANVVAWQHLDHTARTGKNAFVHAHGQSVWAWFDEHPDEQATFADAMTGLTMRQAPVIATLYPFADVHTVCDIGGGRGTLLSELLCRHRHLRGILCDAPGVVELAAPFLAARGVRERVSLQPGNFFERVPTGADAYLLKMVLHDWDDAQCIAILTVVRTAMPPGGKLLLAEMLIEHADASIAALSDVQMMTVCDEGRERSLADFHRLLTASGFVAARVFRSPTIAVIEATAT